MKRPAPSDSVRGVISYTGWALYDDGNPVGGRGACVGDLARIPLEEGADLLLFWEDQRQMQVEAAVVRGLDEVRELVRHDVLEADGRVGGQADVDAYVAG